MSEQFDVKGFILSLPSLLARVPNGSFIQISKADELGFAKAAHHMIEVPFMCRMTNVGFEIGYNGKRYTFVCEPSLKRGTAKTESLEVFNFDGVVGV